VARLRATATPPCRISRRCPIAQRPAPDEGSSGPSHRRGITGHSRRGADPLIEGAGAPHTGCSMKAMEAQSRASRGSARMARHRGQDALGAVILHVAVQRDAVSRAAGPAPSDAAEPSRSARGIAAELQLPPGMATGWRGPPPASAAGRRHPLRPCRHRSAGRAGPTVCPGMDAPCRRSAASRRRHHGRRGPVPPQGAPCRRDWRAAPGEGQALRLSSASSMARSDQRAAEGGDERVHPLGGAGGEMAA